MHRRQLLARVATTGLVLVGGAGLMRGKQVSLSAGEISIVLRAYDEASATLRQAEASANERVYVDLEKQARSGPIRTGPPYFVGASGPELFTPHTPAGKPRTDIDYESMADAIARAIQQMPPPRVQR